MFAYVRGWFSRFSRPVPVEKSEPPAAVEGRAEAAIPDGLAAVLPDASAYVNAPMPDGRYHRPIVLPVAQRPVERITPPAPGCRPIDEQAARAEDALTPFLVIDMTGGASPPGPAFVAWARQQGLDVDRIVKVAVSRVQLDGIERALVEAWWHPEGSRTSSGMMALQPFLASAWPPEPYDAPPADPTPPTPAPMPHVPQPARNKAREERWAAELTDFITAEQELLQSLAARATNVSPWQAARETFGGDR